MIRSPDRHLTILVPKKPSKLKQTSKPQEIFSAGLNSAAIHKTQSTNTTHAQAIYRSTSTQKVDSMQKASWDTAKKCSNALEGELADPSKVNLVGGHINQIRIVSDDVLQKKTSVNECVRYLIIQDSSATAQNFVHLDASSPKTLMCAHEQLQQ